MMDSTKTIIKQTHTVWLFLLLLLVVLAYANTFNASWHLDDMTNIVHNPNVHVASLSAEDLARSVRPLSSDPNKESVGLYRPVAMLTLAMNWFLGGANVAGYHVVNIGIHCLTAVLLFHTSLFLLMAPNMPARYKGREAIIALLATSLWALHPIQTQAVTYIVQRMASLAAMFYLLGIYAYVKGRAAESRRKQVTMFAVCLPAFVLAIGSKQNAATLPAALLLIELIFYSDLKILRQARGRWLAFGGITALVMLVALILYLWPAHPLASLFDSYNLRPFTLYERVLTEFRVLILYLFQIIYPIPQQFSVIHDVELSTSLIDPWSTLPAVAGILFLAGSAIGLMGRFRLFAFAVLFFFLGHSIESTILPLELVFEHRNYLPTLFFFLPIASGVLKLMDVYRKRNTMLFGFLMVSIPLMVLGLVSATYTRNMDWATEKTLWQDAMQKAPQLARPHQALALALENEGRLDEAYALYEKAMALDDPEPKYSRFNSLGNMGNILKKKKDYDRAVDFLTAATEIEKGPYASRVRFNLALCLLNTGREKEALEHLDALIKDNSINYRYLNVKGFVYLIEGDAGEALHFLRMALKRNPDDLNTLLSLGMALSADNALERGEWFMTRAKKQSPRNLAIHLSLLQNAIAMGDAVRVDRYLADIGRLFSVRQIKVFFAEHARGVRYMDKTLVSVDARVILPYVTAYLESKASVLEGAGRGSDRTRAGEEAQR